MVETDRPRVENIMIGAIPFPQYLVDIGAANLSTTSSYRSPTYIPRCLAEVVSKKGYISFEDFAGMIEKSQEEAVSLARTCLKKAHKYLEPNRGIEERENHFVLTFTGIETEKCVTEYGYVHHDTGTLSQSAQDFRDDNRLDPIF